MNHGRFWSSVTILCSTYDGRVTSGPRSRTQNATVGGVADSYHVLGLAADVVLSDYAALPAFNRHADRLGLLVIDERADKNHIHLQPR